MIRHRLPAAIAATLLIAACSKAPNTATSTPAPSVGSALSPAAIQQAAQAAEAASLPQPNWSTPDSDYVEIKQGMQVMFLYTAFSGLPADYDRMAQIYSMDYRMATDSFKKHDLMTALQPKLDAGIADAKAHPYITWTDYQPQLGHYDFNAHAFTDQSALLQQGGYAGFNDASNYQLAVSNGVAFRQLHLTDEAKARQIEALISQSHALRIQLFGFVQTTTDTVSPSVQVILTKEQLLDAHGQVLLEQSVPH